MTTVHPLSAPLARCGTMVMLLPRASCLHAAALPGLWVGLFLGCMESSVTWPPVSPASVALSGSDCHPEKAVKYSGIQKVVKRVSGGLPKDVLGYTEDQLVAYALNSDVTLGLALPTGPPRQAHFLVCR